MTAACARSFLCAPLPVRAADCARSCLCAPLPVRAAACASRCLCAPEAGCHLRSFPSRMTLRS